MSFPRLAFLGVVSITAGLFAACGGKASSQTGSESTGAGGNTTTTTIVDAGSDVNNGMPSDVYPAPHPAPPQVLHLGGPILSSPKFVPVFFSNDDPTYVKPLTDFVAEVGGSAYWTAAVGEYGVGPGKSLPPIMLAEAAPASIDDNGIRQWLIGKLTAMGGAGPKWPANDVNTVYVLHYPAITTITVQGQASCTAFSGFNATATLPDNTDVAYAVIPRCTNLMGIDAITGTESAVLAEAATDPYLDNPAYAVVDDKHHYWEVVLGGGEVGDMCAQFPGVRVKPMGLNFTIQRIWSNMNALAGHDPCQPALPNEVYFNAAPVLPDTVTENPLVEAVKIPLGMSRTIDVDLFSDGPTSGPFTVVANDLASTLGNSSPYLQLSLDRNTGVNGEILHLTIKVLQAGPNNTEKFLMSSKLNGAENIWLGNVSQ